MRKILASIVIGGFLAGGVTTANANDLGLGDDTFANVALGFTFNFYGVDYNNIWVNANGNITMGSGDTDFTQSVPEFLADQARIAPYWDDMSPNIAGSVNAKGDASSMVVSWNGVPEFGADGGSNTFSVTLHSSGNIDFTYDGLTSSNSIVGLSPGGNLGNPGTAVDFSGSSTWALPGLGDQAIYQEFAEGTFDLDGSTISFVPAPGAFALLGLAGLVSRRRRRA